MSSGFSFAFEKEGFMNSFKAKMLLRVLSEDFGIAGSKILDPQGQTVRLWNKIFMALCVFSLFVDPLFLYLAIFREEQCVEIDITLKVTLTVIRSVADVFYVIHMFVRSRTAYVAPSSRVLGRGELVIDSSMVLARYLCRGFVVDLLVALPLPQLLISAVVPHIRGSMGTSTEYILVCIMLAQYLIRLYLIFPLWSQIVQDAGVITQTAWVGAAYNFMLCMLASHTLGAWWYFLSIDSQRTCWRSVCYSSDVSCSKGFFDCGTVNDPARVAWFRSSNVSDLCSTTSKFYDFGIYGQAVSEQSTGSPFFNKYFYCLWWGLQNLNCFGQNLNTSMNVGENCFSILVSILGLVFFALLMGNVQTYLQSLTVQLERWRSARIDIEQWMHHRQLPLELKEAVRNHDHLKWAATKGVDEESILEGLPVGLRRVVKRHLCLNLVRQVNLFNQMDELTLDAICERLKPALYTKGTCLVHEDDIVNKMLFIIRGHLRSCTTNGGTTGFLNTCQLGPGDFCGEELLTWALSPRPRVAVNPLSTRTVRAITDVEGFALETEDLKFVVSQFGKLRSKQLQVKFRFYSQQWRTWAACSIQVAWHRYKNRKLVKAGRGKSDESIVPRKPVEPDFSVDKD